MKNKQYSIAEARRDQIIKAAVEVLREIGYVGTSLSKIANKANISTGLISYHFSGKEDLMNNTLMYLVQKEWVFIKEKVEQKQTPTDKLMAFIEASLAYQGTNRINNIALIEIVFNARTPDNVPYYLIEEEDDDDLLNDLLQEILHKGQDSKEFSNFHPQVIATVIRGAISESMLSSQHKLTLEEYHEKLTKSILKMVK